MSDTEENYLGNLLADEINADLAKQNVAPPTVKPAPAAPSPLDQGKALVVACDSLRALKYLAGELNAPATEHGRWFKALPEATANEIRLTWRARRDALVAGMIAWWVAAWAGVGRGTAEAMYGETQAAEMFAEGTIESALTDIATTGAANAAVQGAGSLAGGQLRFVGFANAEGYVTALRNGVKAATAESYKQTLRVNYGYSAEQIAALTVTLIAESTGPAGKGITHIPTGPDIFEQKKQGKLVGVKTTTRVEVQALLSESTLIGVAVGEGAFLQLSWVGGGTVTLGRVRDALKEIGRENDAPTAPSAEYHAGKAVDGLKTREVDTTRLPNKELPDTVAARWVAGLKLAGNIKAAAPGDAYGSILLTVDLMKNNTLSIAGDETLASAVRSHFESATSKELLKSDKMTSWFGQLLKKQHYAVKRGSNYYVPGGQAEAARQLSETVEKIWGSHDQNEMTTGKGVLKSIAKGLAAEVNKLEGDLAEAQEQAKVRERKAAAAEGLDEAAQKLAEDRAVILAGRAGSLLRDIASAGARVLGYEALLGGEAVAPMRAQLARLRDVVAALCDDTSSRAAMLELD